MTAIHQKLKNLEVDVLNEIFTPLNFEQRIKTLYEFFPEKEVLLTSSFGTKSVFLLHLLHQIRATQKVYFINTTYHFPETLAYKDQLERQYNLNMVEIRPEKEQNDLTREEQWWRDHPRMCCSINKVAPLESVKAKHKVWISGLMAYQTPFRAGLRVFEQQGDIIKFHPFVDIDEGEFLYYMSYHQLPRHPLEEKGYGSIGCLHCTEAGEGREGRWKGSDKTECGLHPGYFENRLRQQV